MARKHGSLRSALLAGFAVAVAAAGPTRDAAGQTSFDDYEIANGTVVFGSNVGTGTHTNGPGEYSFNGNQINSNTANLNGSALRVGDGGIVAGEDNELSTTQNYANALYVFGTGTVELTGGSLTTSGEWAYGAYAKGGGSIELTDTAITTTGNRAFGLQAETGGQITTWNVAIETSGPNAHGVQAYDTDNGKVSEIYLTGGSISTSGQNSYGLLARGGGLITADGVEITTSFAGASGFGAYVWNGSTVVLTGGTTISTQGVGSAGVIVAAGTLVVEDSKITAANAPAIVVRNNGTVTIENSTLSTPNAPSLAVEFVTSDATPMGTPGTVDITLGDGAVATDNDGTLLLVERAESDAGAATGVVNLTLGAGSVSKGDIIDLGEKDGAGGTYVLLEAGATWSGLMKGVSGFETEQGGDVTFLPGSEIAQLSGEGTTFTFEGGATINGDVSGDGNVYSFSTKAGDVTLIAGDLDLGTGSSTSGGTPGSPVTVQGDGVVGPGSNLGGNFHIQGNLFLEGSFGPGNSPGVISVGGDYVSGDPLAGDDTIPDALFEVTFGKANPVAAVDYDQFNVGGNVDGSTVVYLERWDSDASTPLGNLGAIELIRVGGDLDGAFVQGGGRFTQHGHDILLDVRQREADGSVEVAGTGGLDEEAFFGTGTVTVIGLRAVLADEVYGYAAAPAVVGGTALAALGTYVERRGLDAIVGEGPARRVWVRTGGSGENGDVYDSATWFGQAGIDLLATEDGLRAGVMGGYAATRADVATATGDADLRGDAGLVGGYVNWAGGGTYVEGAVQYAWGDWRFRPTDSSFSRTRFDASVWSVSLEAGHGFAVSETVTLMPWAQLVWQDISISSVRNDYGLDPRFDDTQDLILRAGLRAAATLEGVRLYGGVAVAADLLDDGSVTVQGFRRDTESMASRIELDVGADFAIADNVALYATGQVGFGLENGVTAYGGSLGLRVAW